RPQNSPASPRAGLRVAHAGSSVHCGRTGRGVCGDSGMLGGMTTTTSTAGPLPPRLLLVAHGTRSATGRRELSRVLLETRKRLAVDCRMAWVDIQTPGPDRVLADAVPTVVVPLFLARGYHVVEDVAGACRRAPGPVSLTPHLGEEPEVVRALVQRLAAAGGTGAFGAAAAGQGPAGSSHGGAVSLFVARGYHVVEDVAGACRRAPGPVSLTPHLGEEPEVVRALVQRLAEAGGTGAFGADAVVLGAAGSSDADSVSETHALA